MKFRGLSLSLLTGFVLTFALVTGVNAAPPPGTPGADHARVVQYWTPERVAKAIPREVSPERSPGFAPQDKPAGGTAGKPGGGGGSGTTVTGAHWTNQGAAVFRTTGKVLFTMAGVDYVCSGSVVQDSPTSTTTSLILTAGHCVYDEGGSGFATNWMFVPAYEDGGSIVTNPNGTHSFTCDTTPYGCWTATALTTTTAWANGGGSLAGFNNDYGFATVGGGGKTTGDNFQLDSVVGANAIAFNQSHPTQVYAFGYPQASPYNGQQLTYCAGKDVKDTWGGTTDYGLNCNMTGGSSGGPWFIGFNAANGTGTLTSLNSFKYTFGPYSKNMYGPYFGSYAQKTYQAAQSAGANNTVAP